MQHLPRRSLTALLCLYNEVWRTGNFPQAWRHSVIVPVLKAGKDKQNLSSYRPISLTSTVGKIMERLVKDRLMYYLEKNGIFTVRRSLHGIRYSMVRPTIMISSPQGSHIILVSGDITIIPKFEGGHPERGR